MYKFFISLPRNGHRGHELLLWAQHQLEDNETHEGGASRATGLKAHLMMQALGFHTPDCGKGGFVDLPEYPFGKFRA